MSTYALLSSYLKRGTYNVICYAFNTTAIRVLNLLILPYFLTHLSLTDFGIWDFYQMFFSIGSLLTASCASTAMIRFYLHYQHDKDKQNQIVGNSFLFGTLSSLLFLFGGTAFSYFVSKTMYFYLIVVNVTLFAFFSLIIAYLRATEQLGYYTLLFMGQSIIALLLTIFGVWHHQGVSAFFYANIISYLAFLPFFIHLLSKYFTFSLELFKEQLIYSLPLAFYSFLYAGLFSIDRSIIQHYLGYELLGTHALLWRFGSIFQFFCVALIDTWPIMVFNAQKETNGSSLIARIATYYCIIFATLILYLIIASSFVIHYLFPLKYHALITYLPLFFFPLLFLEIARIFQAAFSLSNKTVYIPIILVVTLGIQYVLLNIFKGYGLQGIYIGNTITFVLYMIISYMIQKKIYPLSIIESKSIIKLCTLFQLYWTAIMCYWNNTISWSLSFLAILSWPCALWLIVLQDEEKKLFFSLLAKLTKKDRSVPAPEKNLLYLRTDICYAELTAGGSVAHTLGVIKGFQDHGYQVYCASSAMPSLLKKINGIFFQQLNMYPLFVFLRWKFGYLRWRLECIFSSIFFVWQLKNIVKKNHISLIYQRYSLLNCTGFILSKWKKIPFILEYNGSEVWHYNQLGKNKWFKFNKLSRYIEKLNLIHADTIVVVSQALKDELQIYNIDHKILVNPNGVDATLFNPASLDQERNIIRNQFNISNSYVFGFIGTFSFWHGIEVLAKIIPAIITQKSQAHFLLIGDGTLVDFLKNELSHNGITQTHVTFTGIVDQSRSKQYLAACDAFLSPTQSNTDGTRFFGSPTKLFEYMSMEKPIIASQLEQITEIINPALSLQNLKDKISITNQLGILIPPTHHHEFAHAACSLLELSSEDQKKLGINARNKILQQYTWNHHVNMIETFFNHMRKEIDNESRTY